MFFSFFISCDKDANKPVIEPDNKYQLTISRNNKLFEIFIFNDQQLLSQFNYDTFGIIKEKHYYHYSTQRIKKDFLDKDSVLLSYQIYKLDKNNLIDTILVYNKSTGFTQSNHGYIFKYSNLGKIDTIMDKAFSNNEHLDIGFVWSGNNVSEKKFPLSSGFPQYYYDYDNKPSIYKLIKAPVDVNIGTLEVAEIPLSDNNIKKVSVKKMVNNDFTFETITYELYNSSFIYNKDGYITSELRHYKDHAVKFDYKIDTIK